VLTLIPACPIQLRGAGASRYTPSVLGSATFDSLIKAKRWQMTSPTDATAHVRDRALIARMAEGDDRALGELYDRYGAMLYALAHRILGDPAEAEEAVADAFAQAWRDASRFEAGRGSGAAWLVVMVRTRALDLARSSRRRARVAVVAAGADPNEFAASPDAGVLSDERSRLVRGAIAQLSPIQREAIELVFYGGLTQSETAARLGAPLGTVKTRIRDGMQKLRDALSPLLQD
jgi:RNA polymerase sigma-70 factor (ECF subfamily)